MARKAGALPDRICSTSGAQEDASAGLKVRVVVAQRRVLVSKDNRPCGQGEERAKITTNCGISWQRPQHEWVPPVNTPQTAYNYPYS